MKHIILTSPPDGELAERWNSFISRERYATHYTSPNYFKDPFIKASRFAVLAADLDGQIAGVATGVTDQKVISSGLFSRPQSIVCSGAGRAAAISALMDGFEELSGPETELLELHTWEEEPALTARGLHVRPSNEQTSVVMLDLSDGANAVFTGFSQTRRNEIRKAVRQGIIEVKPLETDEELAQVYRIHCDWNERKGNISDTFEQLSTAAGQKENRRIFIAKVGDKVVAASFYRFCSGGVVEYASNFSIPEFQRFRPNDLIGWHAIQWACEEGLKYFSMGGSHLFLRRFGGVVKRTFRYRKDLTRLRRHQLSESARDLGVQVFKRLPENVRTGVRKVLTK